MPASDAHSGSRRRLASALIAAVILTASCGGGDGPTEPPVKPPEAKTVASVEVTPATGNLTLPATTQLTATARDATGAVVSGQTIIWSSSANAVATVNQSGLVTAVGVGTTTVTASTSGKQGHATITVAEGSTYGPVVAQAVIGPDGGTVSGADVGVTVPVGAFATPRTVKLIRDTAISPTPGTPYATPQFVINGIPSGQTVDVRVRVRYTGTPTGTTAIGVEQPAQASGDEITNTLGLSLYKAIDSAGFLVATVPVTGRPATWSSVNSGLARMQAPSAGGFDVMTLDADALLSGLFGLANATSANGRFSAWGFVALDADAPRKAARAVTLLDQAYTKLVTDMGYTPPERTWPMQVTVSETDGSNGIFTQYHPYPFNHSRSMITIRNSYIDDAEAPGTAIHELYHFMQQRFRTGLSIAEYRRNGWLQEATASWVAEKHPAAAAPYFGGTPFSWRDSLFGGLSTDMVARSGYGKAPMIKYVAKRWGDAKVREIWGAMGPGVSSPKAFLDAIPEPVGTWWPLALTAYFGGSLYPWSGTSLIPPRKSYNLGLTPKLSEFVTDPLRPLGAEVLILNRDTAMFGPDFQLKVALGEEARGKAKLLVFEKLAAATAFRPILGTDTVVIPGNRLQSKDTIIVVVTRTHWDAGFGTASYPYQVDLRFPEGDWTFANISNVNDNIHFACSDTSDTEFDVASNAETVWRLLSRYGTWKWKSAAPVTYDWTVNPLYVDTLAEAGMSLTSSLTTNDSSGAVRVQGRIRVQSPATDAANREGGFAFLPFEAANWWLLLPFGVLALVAHRALPQLPTRRRVGLLAGGAVLTTLASCVGIKLVEYRVDESFDYTFTRVRYTANPDNPSAPLMELTDGVGKSTMNEYAVKLYAFTTDPITEVTDSTLVTCTAGGSATYKVDGIAYGDGLSPDDEEEEEEMRADASAAARLARESGIRLSPAQAAQVRKAIQPQ